MSFAINEQASPNHRYLGGLIPAGIMLIILLVWGEHSLEIWCFGKLWRH